jgi:hypothetical protein
MQGKVPNFSKIAIPKFEWVLCETDGPRMVWDVANQ